MTTPLALFLSFAALAAACALATVAGLDPARFGLPAVAFAILANAYRPAE